VKRWQWTLLAAAAALGLQACDQQASRTSVTPPTASLPDNAPLGAASGTNTAAAPADAQSTATNPQAAASGNLPTTTADTQPTTSGDNPQPPSASADPAAAAASSPSAGDTVAAPAGAQTSSMGAPAATMAGAGVPDGTAAPTELARFFDETNGGTRTSAAPSGNGSTANASSNGTPATASGNSTSKGDAKPQAKAGQKVSGELPTVRNPGDPQGAVLLAQRALQVPVVGIQPTGLSDMYEQGRGSRKHEAIDILAPSGTPVVAVDDGRITKLFTSKAGGLTIYQFDRQAQLAYYYAHLQRYANTVREGMDVKRGDVIGYVGTTGNADANTPHLHFAVFRLGNPPQWWKGEPVNPYPALSRAEPADQVAVR
jgi:peptidoglycan LD-endopeptidase LytH